LPSIHLPIVLVNTIYKIVFCIIRAYLCQAEELEAPFSLVFDLKRAEIPKLYGV
jgi:hypothetical protein